jgi:hypothetical protein
MTRLNEDQSLVSIMTRPSEQTHTHNTSFESLLSGPLCVARGLVRSEEQRLPDVVWPTLERRRHTIFRTLPIFRTVRSIFRTHTIFRTVPHEAARHTHTHTHTL